MFRVFLFAICVIALGCSNEFWTPATADPPLDAAKNHEESIRSRLRPLALELRTGKPVAASDHKELLSLADKTEAMKGGKLYNYYVPCGDAELPCCMTIIESEGRITSLEWPLGGEY